MLERLRREALQAGCRRLWLVTTNDNLNALRFYQKRGFPLVEIYRGSLDYTRTIKPIPAIAADGIPFRDEIELEQMLNYTGSTEH